MNVFRTGLLLAVLTALFMGVGYLLGGPSGMMIALVIALATNLYAFWNADKIVLRMYKARKVDARTAPQFYGLVEQLAQRASLPMPNVYIIDNPQPNAFATGRNPDNAAVAATTGLLDSLSYEEIAGVMAHELAHVRNRDTLVMTVTATIAGAIGILGNLYWLQSLFGGNNNNGGSPIGLIGAILLMVVAPLAAGLVQMARSRTREYGADAGGAEICGQPLWLASALQKLDQASKRIDNTAAERNPATAHMFIVNPLHARATDNLFSTHPSTANRVERLLELAGPGASTPRGTTGPAETSGGPWSGSPSRRRRPPSTRPAAGPWG